MLHGVGIAAVILYVISACVSLSSLIRKNLSGRKQVFWIFALGFILHTVVLGLLFIDGKLFPLKTSSNYYLIVSWIIPVITIAGKLSYPVVLVFVSTLTALLFASSSILIHQPLTDSGAGNYFLFGSHVLPALLAEVCLAIAFVVSTVFLVQDRRLRSKASVGDSLVGPSLQKLDIFRHRSIVMGFALMTVALISGSAWAAATGEHIFSGDLTRVTALVVWVVLGMLLHLRYQLRWSSKRMSKATVFTIGVLLGISIIVVPLVSGNVLHGI